LTKTRQTGKLTSSFCKIHPSEDEKNAPSNNAPAEKTIKSRPRLFNFQQTTPEKRCIALQSAA